MVGRGSCWEQMTGLSSFELNYCTALIEVLTEFQITHSVVYRVHKIQSDAREYNWCSTSLYWIFWTVHGYVQTTALQPPAAYTNTAGFTAQYPLWCFLKPKLPGLHMWHTRRWHGRERGYARIHPRAGPGGRRFIFLGAGKYVDKTEKNCLLKLKLSA